MKKWISCVSISCLLLLSGLTGCGQAEQSSGNPEKKESEKKEQAKKGQRAKEQQQKQQEEAKRKEQQQKQQEEAKRKEQQKKPKDVNVKGIYMSGASAGSDAKFNELVKLVENTELNALVIDVKGDEGKLTYDSNLSSVHQYGSDQHPAIKNLSQRMKVLNDKKVYKIARIVTFKDPFMAKKNKEFAMKKKKDGSLYYNDGIPWVDPYKEEYWKYVTSVAKEAAKLGFDEIQFDYVRFPDNGAEVDREVKFDNPKNKSKAQNIHDFLVYAKKELKPYGVKVSADVFGVSTSAKDDTGIGQQWESLTQAVDVISPMTYPSHYGNDVYGLKVPDAKPYETIKRALQPAVHRDKVLEKQKKPVAEIRPWYQDFTATWVDGHIDYGPKQVKDQIRAGQELGIDEYLLWNPQNNYSEKAFKRKE